MHSKYTINSYQLSKTKAPVISHEWKVANSLSQQLKPLTEPISLSNLLLYLYLKHMFSKNLWIQLRDDRDPVSMW